MYNKIGVAVAFSPRCEAIVGESARLQNLFNSELVIIHVGDSHPDEKEYLDEIIKTTQVNTDKLKIVWEAGEPSKKILAVANKENIDLLVAGAIHKESVMKFYFGSIARKLIRKSACSVLMLINPSFPAKPFEKIVINGSDGESNSGTISRGISLAKLEHARRVHIFKSIKFFGLSMALASEEETEHRQEETRRDIVGQEIREIEKILQDIDTQGLQVNIKVSSGKPGYELRKFTQRVHADLLILKNPAYKLNLLDRIFPHHLEMILEDLPSNLLIDKS